MTVLSDALEANVRENVTIEAVDPAYHPLQELLAIKYGIRKNVEVLLKELSHPYRNWQFIVGDCRKYALEYIDLFVKDANQSGAAAIVVNIFFTAIDQARSNIVKMAAVDALVLFLQKLILGAGTKTSDFAPMLETTFQRIEDLPKEHFSRFVKSYYQIRRIGELLYETYRLDKAFDTDLSSVASPAGQDGRSNTLDSIPDNAAQAMNRLLEKYYHVTYDYWLTEADPHAWFEKKVNDNTHTLDLDRTFFANISHDQLLNWQRRLNELCEHPREDPLDLTRQMIDLPGYGQVVANYRRVPPALYKAGGKGTRGQQWKAIFLFHMMNIAGLEAIHEETLREINRTLQWLIQHESYRNIHQLIQKTFSILKLRVDQYPFTILNSSLNMGKGVYQTDERDLVNAFIDAVIDLGFQAPLIGKVSDDWQIEANPAHIQNIRTWLELIELNPKWSVRLLSGLIIHLALCGVYIKDTDLFFRDVTQLFNSPIQPAYNLVKQLIRLFPVFFNDIGAEGELRDISTEIDELTHRRDVLIHFLRKQCHVESSNRTLILIEAVIVFWQTRDKSGLEDLVPPQIFAQIAEDGPYIDGVHQAMTHLKAQGLKIPQGLLEFSPSQLETLLTKLESITPLDHRRIVLLADFYRFLRQKYRLGYADLTKQINALQAAGFPRISALARSFKETNSRKKTTFLLDAIRTLKQMVLSDKTFEAQEDIYKKRHFTIDIPSTYGSYHEQKFDAMGLMLRIESQVNILFEEMIAEIDLALITKATFFRIYDILNLFKRALKLEGMSIMEYDRQLGFLYNSLEVRGFTFTQYIDIFKGFAQAVKNVINDGFNNLYDSNLTKIVAKLPESHLLPKYRMAIDLAKDPDKAHHSIFEVFFRDRIATSLGLQQLDRFLTTILQTLFQQSEKLSPEKLHLLLLYDHQRAMAPLKNPHRKIAGIIYLGNKGHNLYKLNEIGIQTPPGFVITTEVFKGLEVIEAYKPAERNLYQQLASHIRQLEKESGKIFGDPSNPLLLSVRSGASISQPGMMDTFLDVGINVDIAEGLAEKTGNRWFAFDNYRRFLQCYGMGLGLDRDDFDELIRSFKRQVGIELKRDLTGNQMRDLALIYKENIESAGFAVPDDPWDQLIHTVKQVFTSWFSDKAKAYRRIMGISDDWGTAVTLQSMVYGNVSRRSGSGVVFTHNPRWAGDTLRLWGDFTIGNQGEDVVAGLVQTLPISITQQDVEMRNTDIVLEKHFPNIYQQLKAWALELIENRGWSPQEMEFTFEDDTAIGLFLLQTRDMAIRERRQVDIFDPAKLDAKRYLSSGIGVSGGGMYGRAVFDLTEIEEWRRNSPKEKLILLRNDTVPDDIREIYAADGLLTARGGMTSHAAVVAHRLEKTCVVGCTSLICDEIKKECRFESEIIRSGDFISIDGYKGAVYKGKMAILKT